MMMVLPRRRGGAPELVINGTFDTDLADWTTLNAPGWTWVDGKAQYTRNNGTEAAYQGTAVTNGANYRIQFVISNASSSGVRLNWQTNVPVSGLGGGNIITDAGNGTYDVTRAATSSTMRLVLGANANNVTFRIDDISIKLAP